MKPYQKISYSNISKSVKKITATRKNKRDELQESAKGKEKHWWSQAIFQTELSRLYRISHIVGAEPTWNALPCQILQRSSEYGLTPHINKTKMVRNKPENGCMY
jgi:hypothetical protein